MIDLTQEFDEARLRYAQQTLELTLIWHLVVTTDEITEERKHRHKIRRYQALAEAEIKKRKQPKPVAPRPRF